MQKQIAYLCTTLLATVAVSIGAPSQDEMMEKEKAAWEAFKGKDAAAFQKLVDHDVVAVYDNGIKGMDQELADMKKMDMKSFAISDFKAHSDEKDVVVTSYTVKIEGTMDGQDMGGTYNAGSVWKMENGKWLAIFHTNIKQIAATGPEAQKKE